jgi:two-component system, NarL family, nitrate/nitrite response regulator NarL
MTMVGPETISGPVITIAIYSVDPILRGKLEQLGREDSALAVVGAVDDASKLRKLIDQDGVDVVLVDAPSRAYLADWRLRHHRPVLMVLVDASDDDAGLTALNAGARGVLLGTLTGAEIVAAIKSVMSGHVVLPRELLAAMLSESSPSDRSASDDDTGHVRLTPRELEVLAAMADGASNKAIARRLGISFHTAKFHVAAILAKLDADSRTEAVTKAAQLGLVML